MTSKERAMNDQLFDGIKVINLAHRPERMDAFRANSASHFSLAGFERLDAVNGQTIHGYGKKPWFGKKTKDRAWAGRAGCVLSHREAITKAKEKSWQSLLILEDDIIPSSEFDKNIAEVLESANRLRPNWSVLYLGISKQVGPALYLKSLSQGRKLYETSGALGTFAYIVRGPAVEWILKRLPAPGDIWPWIAFHKAIDRWYALNLNRDLIQLAVCPSMVSHYASFSDIGQRSGASIGHTHEEQEDGSAIQPTHKIFFEMLRLIHLIKIRMAFPIQYLHAFRKSLRGL
jgi:GR25 family glycosyltransferase involved in LPS biosynthesis